MLRVTTYSDLRAHLKSYCDEVAENGEPILVRRKSGTDVALVSVDELVGLEETAHLLRSPRNAERLAAALEEVGGGGGVELTVEDLERRFDRDGRSQR